MGERRTGHGTRDKEEKGNHENTKNSVSQFVGAGFNRHHRGFAVYLAPCPVNHPLFTPTLQHSKHKPSF